MGVQETRRLAAVWFADIVGYTALSARDEDGALAVVRELERVARQEVESRNGRVVKSIGDAVLCVFESADSSLRGALAMQRAFSASPTVQSLGCTLRIGVHLGEVVAAPDGDVFGDGVNMASRVQGAAPPGEVVVTDAVHQQIRHRKQFVSRAFGPHPLKGFDEEVVLHLVSWAGEEEIPRDPPGPATSGHRKALVRGKVIGSAILLGVAAFAVMSVVTATWSGKEPEEPAVELNELQQVTATGRAVSGSLSPDGKLLAWLDGLSDVSLEDSTGAYRLYVKRVGTSAQTLLAEHANRSHVPQWTPDGGEILYEGSLGTGETRGIYAVSPQGGAPRWITGPLRNPWTASESPGAFYYLSEYLDDRSGMPHWEKPSVVVRFTTGPPPRHDTIAVVPPGEHGRLVVDLKESPGGDRLLLVTWADILVGRSDPEPLIIDVSSGKVRTAPVPDSTAYWVQWNAAGNGIYFYVGDLVGEAELEPHWGRLRRVAAASGLPGLATGDFDPITMSVTSDLQQMVVPRVITRSTVSVARIDDHGRLGPATLVSPRTGSAMEPVLSPDGSQVAYYSGRGLETELFLAPTEGGDARQLTYFGAAVRDLVWSGDGSTVVATVTDMRSLGTAVRIMAIPVGGGPPRELGSMTEGMYPDPSSVRMRPGVWIDLPDGSFPVGRLSSSFTGDTVYFADPADRVVRLHGGGMEYVSWGRDTLAALMLSVSPDGKSMAVSDSLGLLSVSLADGRRTRLGDWPPIGSVQWAHDRWVHLVCAPGAPSDEGFRGGVQVWRVNPMTAAAEPVVLDATGKPARFTSLPAFNGSGWLALLSLDEEADIWVMSAKH